MRVDEGKRRVAGERDPLSRRPKRGGARGRRRPFEFAGQRKHAAAIDVRLDEVGDRLEPGLERMRFARLHEAEMALGQRDLVVARQRAEDRNPHRLDRVDDEPAMALAADAIDDDAGDAEPRVVSRAALDHRRRRLRLPGNVEDEQDRHAERRRDVGRGAGAPALRRNAVEEAHRGFAERELALAAASAASAESNLGGMAQESRLTPSRPDAAAWKAGSM